MERKGNAKKRGELDLPTMTLSNRHAGQLKAIQSDSVKELGQRTTTCPNKHSGHLDPFWCFAMRTRFWRDKGSAPPVSQHAMRTSFRLKMLDGRA
eukprot:6805108-Alexandrium_andersonii.AAC.1